MSASFFCNRAEICRFRSNCRSWFSEVDNDVLFPMGVFVSQVVAIDINFRVIDGDVMRRLSIEWKVDRLSSLSKAILLIENEISDNTVGVIVIII